jgi:hypothetical protein
VGVVGPLDQEWGLLDLWITGGSEAVSISISPTHFIGLVACESIVVL